MPMKRVWRHVIAGLAASAFAGAVAVACAHDDSTIFIFNVLTPTTTTLGQPCASFSANPSQSVIPSGALDIDFGFSPYVAEFLVGNQLVAQGDPTVPRTETSYVQVQGAIVRITAADGTAITSYTDLGGGGIPPAVGGSPGFLAIHFTIVDSATVQAVGAPLDVNQEARVITYTKIFGKTYGGQYVESNEFEFPVDICRGCLVEFTPADINTVSCNNPINCVGNSTNNAATTTTQTVPCRIGQDLAVSCAFCKSNPNNPHLVDCNPACIIDAGRD
jgi:hypothetical protein